VAITCVTLAIVGGHAALGRTQGRLAAWLDEPQPRSWNAPRGVIPVAPTLQDAASPRCSDAKRPPESDEDRRIRDRGWQLVGPYQGGWQMLVIRGTAGYDGMCRPRNYQDFVFVRGVFAGTMSPQSMDSRADGALRQVWIQSATRLSAEYDRYAAADPLCCPSGKTTVVFEIEKDTTVLRPVSASTSRR